MFTIAWCDAKGMVRLSKIELADEAVSLFHVLRRSEDTTAVILHGPGLKRIMAAYKTPESPDQETLRSCHRAHQKLLDSAFAGDLPSTP